MSTKPLASQVRYVEPLGAETTVQAKLNTLSIQSDQLKIDLSSSEGGEIVGYDGERNYASGTIGAVIRDIFVNVRAFPWLAKGDGVTDDTAAIQAAVNAAGNNAVIFFPLGRYKLTAPLVMPAANTWQKLQGVSFPTNAGGPTAGVNSCLFFVGLADGQHGVVTNTYATIEDLGIFGPGVTASSARRGISVASEVNLKNVMCMNWDTGLYIRTSYYTRLQDVTLRANSLGMDAARCFALTAINMKINGGGRNEIKTRGDGVLLGSGNYNFYGGTVEVYWGALGYAFNLFGNAVAVNLNGVYFEPYGSPSEVARCAIYVEGRGSALTIDSCTAYIYEQEAFVEYNPDSSQFSLVSRNNNFRNGSESSGGTLYKLPSAALLAGCSVDLYGDNLYNTIVKPVYVSPAITGTFPGLPNCNITPPRQGFTGAIADHSFAGRPVANVVLSAPPINPLRSVIYWANGSTWNPFKSDFLPYPVIYDGTVFHQVVRPSLISTANNVNRTLLRNERVNCITNTSAVTISLLAAPSDGDSHTVKIFGGVNPVTVSGNGRLIDGASTQTLSGGSYQAITVVFSQFVNQWLITGKT